MQADYDWALERLDNARHQLRTAQLTNPADVQYWRARVSELEDNVSDMLSRLEIL